MTLARRVFIGLLWLSLGSALFATPIVVPGIDPHQYDQAATAALASKVTDPQHALEELCFNPPYFIVLPDPTQEDDTETADYSDVTPATATFDVGSLSPPPSSLALSGASLLMAGLVRRRARV